jgi:uncharacterized protein
MSTKLQSSAPATPAVPEPWWRVGFVWLVVGGPLTVVVAALVTAAIAVAGAEEVLTDAPADVSRTDAAALPAMQGRNHAATPRP